MSRARMTIVAAIARHALSVGAGMVTIALLGRGLGRAALGAWALIGTSATFISLADLGLSATALKHSVCDKDGALAARTVALAQWTTLAIAPLLIALSSVIYLSELRGAITASVASASALRVAAISALAAGTIAAYTSAHRAWLVGKGATKQLAVARASAAFTQVALTAAGLWAGAGIAAPALAVCASSLVESVIVLRICRRMDTRLGAIPSAPPSARELVSALRESSAALAVNAASVVAVRVDVAVLARVAPLAAVGAHQLSLRLSDQLYTLVKQVSAAMQHRLATREGRDAAFALGTVSMTATLASALIVLAVCGRALLRAWAGSIVDEPVFSLSIVLTGTAAVFAISCELASSALHVGARSQWSAARPHIVGALVNAALTLAFARAFGVWAIAGATIVGNAVTALLTFRALLAFNESTVRSLARSLTPIAPPVAVASAAALLFAPLSRTVVGSMVACAAAAILSVLTQWIVARRTSAQEAVCASPSLLPP